MSRPIVAIVGRQNAGKSTLLNRVVGKRLAIVQDLPGTTRDRVVATVSWGGHEFTLVDTGGLEMDEESPIARRVQEQIGSAISEADVIVFLVDVRSGVTPPDIDIADMLRRSGKPVLLAANKADNARQEAEAVDFYQLGLDEPLPVSAHHGRGIADLLDRITHLLPEAETAPVDEGIMKVAIVGRPNVGKSMLLNSILGEERAIVHDAPGTTRDAVDTHYNLNGHDILLIDTAGIRRRGRVEAGVERYSVMRSLRAIDRADVALFVMDATEPVTAQDTHIAGYVQQASKGIVVVINKWDLVTEQDQAEWEKHLITYLKFIAYAPILFTSAKSGQGVKKLLPKAEMVFAERSKRLPTAKVNDVVQEAIAQHNLPRRGRRQLKLLYATQAETNPPTFVFFINDAKLVHFSYRRYLENKLRQSFGFTGTPIRLIFKSRGEE